MTSLSRQKCFNHETREAGAKCLECGRFFCRECITEHEDRVLCTNCIKSLSTHKKKKRMGIPPLKDLACFVGGFAIIWMIFYYFGVKLILLPSEFHEAMLW